MPVLAALLGCSLGVENDNDSDNDNDNAVMVLRLEQEAQRRCGCPILGIAQGQVG